MMHDNVQLSVSVCIHVFLFFFRFPSSFLSFLLASLARHTLHIFAPPLHIPATPCQAKTTHLQHPDYTPQCLAVAFPAAPSAALPLLPPTASIFSPPSEFWMKRALNLTVFLMAL